MCWRGGGGGGRVKIKLKPISLHINKNDQCLEDYKIEETSMEESGLRLE